ncbi:S1-C subfamily serine protease [Sporosarcina luteola]|nr:S1-C subfamily serine protease [Sporosarcina luteola]
MDRDQDIKDHPLYEDLTEEEMNELALQARQEALESGSEQQKQPKRRLPRWFAWLLSLVLLCSTFAGLFQVFSIPAIDFLITSAKLSQHDDIALYKQAVVVVVTEDGKGTGFSISADGTILTNYHVIEGNETVTVVFPEHGRYAAEVVQTAPSIDIAVLQVDAKDLPTLSLEENGTIEKDESIRFIGNPLSFKGIANKGVVMGPTRLNDWNEDVIMIKAPVYRGNSGSPVFNEEGLVIGVIFATLEDDDYGKVGLFIPAHLLKKYAVSSH